MKSFNKDQDEVSSLLDYPSRLFHHQQSYLAQAQEPLPMARLPR